MNRLVLCYGDEHTDDSWTIKELYGPKAPRVVHGTTLVDSNPLFYLSRKSYICEWPSHFPQDWSATASLPTFPKGVIQNTIIYALNNLGFDIVVFENKRANGVECEY